MQRLATLCVLVLLQVGCGGDPFGLGSDLAGSCSALSDDDETIPTTQPLSGDGQARFIVHLRADADSVQLATRYSGRLLRTFAQQRASSMLLSPKAAAKLANDPQVLSIEEDAPRALFAQTLPPGVALTGAPAVWQSQLPGTRGMKTCIIDSGVHLNHADLPKTGMAGSPADWSVDGCGHGTHVAGTIAALENDFGVVGVVHNGVDLVFVKIFGSDCKQTSASDLTHAVDQCINAGARVINMSLGGDRPTDLERETFENAWRKGVLLVAAAGNDGSSTLQYPASYASVLSIAALNSNSQVASYSQHNAQVDLAAPGTSIVSTSPFEGRYFVTVNGTRFEGAAFAGSGSTAGKSAKLVWGGTCGATSSAYSGKIVLCARGSYSFVQKVNSVQNSGGIGVLISNNDPGNFSGSLGTSTTSLPVLSLSEEDGAELKLLAGADALLVSEYTKAGSGYATMSGTSMASPHVAGVASLIWGEVPGATNAQVRAALESSAKDLGDLGRDDNSGAGLIQAKPALEALREGLSSNAKPEVAFSVRCVGTFCAFTSTSIDPDGQVRSWRFDLGDGAVTYGPMTLHQFAGAGPYNVTLTVTDDRGEMSQLTTPVSVVQAQLNLEHDAATAVTKAKLSWAGFSESAVLVFKNGDLTNTVQNSGGFEEPVDTAERAPMYQVCTRSLESCSDLKLASQCR
jgi:serine protease